MTKKIVPRGRVSLQRIAMVVPTAEFIYAPSRLNGHKTITEAEFLERYADHARVIQVSFAEDGKSDPQPITAYGYGLDCWYIVLNNRPPWWWLPPGTA